ncbi:MAG TPA: DUF2272 domain-containing protein [Pseudolabrys sp.]|nr:DUF2272 domain-containing protein [Pseudolabrys sp.]
MRAVACLIAAAIALAAPPGFARTERAAPRTDHAAARFWQDVQATCNATAAKPASALGRAIAQAAIDEFDKFGGHKIDSTGRMFEFGLTEAEHAHEDGHADQEHIGDLGWWRVLQYWRALYGTDADGLKNELEVRGYGDASASNDAAKSAALLALDFGPLLRAADGVADPATRETLRESIIRSAMIDTPWSAAFISYVIRQAGVAADGFQFANAHRVYIYDAFATSMAEQAHRSDARIYRACPLESTKPRVGDMICMQREPALSRASAGAVRERIRSELADNAAAHSVQRTHCEVVAHVDTAAHKVYTIGGNVLNSVTARKLNLRRGMKLSAVQKGHCGGPGEWTLPRPKGAPPSAKESCSFNDKKWFVLLQLR